MSTTQWNDKECCLCGNLAQYRSYMYLEHKPAPGTESLCRTCKDVAILPPKTIVEPVKCATLECGGRAEAEFELLPGPTGEPGEMHCLCIEHGWRWKHSLGIEREIFWLAYTPEAKPVRFVRDDLRGAFTGDESQEVN